MVSSCPRCLYYYSSGGVVAWTKVAHAVPQHMNVRVADEQVEHGTSACGASNGDAADAARNDAHAERCWGRSTRPEISKSRWYLLNGCAEDDTRQ